jgi:hypothetical protein
MNIDRWINQQVQEYERECYEQVEDARSRYAWELYRDWEYVQLELPLNYSGCADNRTPF